MTNKRKIINDPVYGFLTIEDDLIFDVLSHPYFQRQRRIKQLGFTCLVYPGAIHPFQPYPRRPRPHEPRP